MPTCVLVALPNEERRADCDRIAGRAARRGIPTEVAPAAAKFGKQIQVRRPARHPVRLVPRSDGETDSVKDIRSGDQVEADAASWSPPAVDLHPTIAAG